MNALFNAATRVSIHHRDATAYPAGPDFVSVVFDQGQPKTFSRSSFVKAHRNREVVIKENFQTTVSLDSLGNVSPKDLSKIAYLNVLRTHKFQRSRRTIKAVIRQVSSDFPLDKIPAVSTVYNWLRAGDEAGQEVDPQRVFEPKKRKCDSRLSNEANALINDVIDAYYMQPTLPTVMHVYKIFKKEFQKISPENTIRFPHKSTFYNRIAALCPHEVELKRKGRSAAKLLRRTVLQQICTENVLEAVQLDAVHLSIPIYDDEDNLLGYPVVHIAIDVFSRAVMGFSVELGSESAAGVVECIQSAVSAKYHEDHSYTKNDWEMFGKPQEFITDGGSAYTSESVIRTLSIMKITRIVNKSYTPWHKGIVERFNLTLRMQFASLFTSYIGRRKDARDLHTLKKYGEKVTLKQFKKALTCYIVDDYNQSPHNSLLTRTPANTWLDSAEFVTPMVPAQLEKAMMLKGNLLSAKFSPLKGIRVNNVFYNSKELQEKYLSHHGRKVFDGIDIEFYYNPMNIENITVEIGTEFIHVPVSTSDYPVTPGMSFAEHKEQRNQRQKDAEAENDLKDSRVDISEKIDEIIGRNPTQDNAADRSKKSGPAMPLDKINRKTASMNSKDNFEEEVEEEYTQDPDCEMSPDEYEAALDSSNGNGNDEGESDE